MTAYHMGIITWCCHVTCVYHMGHVTWASHLTCPMGPWHTRGPLCGTHSYSQHTSEASAWQLTAQSCSCQLPTSAATANYCSKQPFKTRQRLPESRMDDSQTRTTWRHAFCGVHCCGMHCCKQ